MLTRFQQTIPSRITANFSVNVNSWMVTSRLTFLASIQFKVDRLQIIVVAKKYISV